MTGDFVVGWAALSPLSERCVYEGVAEVSVFVDADYHGRGIGKMLLQALIEKSEEAGVWTLGAGVWALQAGVWALQAGVFPENAEI